MKRIGIPPKPTPIAPVEMADVVAQAIYRTAGADEGWNDLSAEEKADWLHAAHAAIAAHDAYLIGIGFRLVPPGTFPAPVSAQEAEAMEKAGRLYSQKFAREAKLVRPDGKPLVAAH